jgi:hypothetical protein
MPIVLLGLAKQYQAAANRLIDTSTRDEVFSGFPLPLLFLFHHSVELALKAFLGAHQVPIVRAREHHRIVDLYKECGLSVLNLISAQFLLIPTADSSFFRFSMIATRTMVSAMQIVLLPYRQCF